MSDGSSIEWTDATWTIAVGCTRVSEGCNACYAISFVHRGLHESHKGLTIVRPKSATRPGVDWNGKVRTLPENLSQPLQWKKPRRVFVGSMTDLFHHKMPFEYIAAVFGVMAMASHHTYQVLTKRPARMLEFFAWLDEQAKLHHIDALRLARANGGRVKPDPRVLYCVEAAAQAGVVWMDLASATRAYSKWPLDCVHLGTSVEDQATADERIPLLLQAPAVIRWISCEPMIGWVDLHYAIDARQRDIDHRDGDPSPWAKVPFGVVLDWVVMGGESGPRARGFKTSWAFNTIEEARGTRTRFYMKQLGSRPYGASGPGKSSVGPKGEPRAWYFDDGRDEGGKLRTYRITARNGGNMSEWPADIRVREAPPGHSAAWDAAMARMTRR